MEKVLRTVKLAEIRLYSNNPRRNEDAVEAVAESIRQCEYVAPIVVDEAMEILAGHTRYKALQSLGKSEVEVLVVSGLSEEQKRKYRLLDNKTAEAAGWDWDKLQAELEMVDFGNFDFGWDMCDIDLADVDDISEEAYSAPEHELWTCPSCGHVDRKEHFKKK